MRDFIEKQLQKTLNRYLALDPESKRRIEHLSGKRVAIELSPIGLNFYLEFKNGDIKLKTQSFSKFHTVIKGTPLSLLHLSVSKDRKSFFAEDVTIEGDVELGQEVIELFDALDIDWEEHLSHWIGDVPSHQIGRAARQFILFNKRLKESMTDNLNEYVHEEVDLFPTREALADFFQDVDQLRMDTDRLEARILQLIKE